MALITGLIKIVDQKCTEPQIHALLSQYKKINELTEKEIRLSGGKQVLLENLEKNSLGRNPTIPRSEVYQLVRESEENGHQHVYFFQPSSEAVSERCKEAVEVGNALFGEDQWADAFPVFDRATETLKWADFRASLPGKPKDWLVKMYGHERIFRLKHRKKKDISPTHYRLLLDYKVEDYNTVYVVRWNHPGVLEIRLDQVGIEKTGVKERRLQDIWKMLGNALPESGFKPWDLRSSMTKMLKDRGKNTELYELGTCRIEDLKRGAIDFSPLSVDEKIDEDAGRSEAIDILLAHKGKGAKLVINWKNVPSDTTKKMTEKEREAVKPVPLRSVLTGDHHNCLVIASKVSAKVMDYVGNRLRGFAS